MSIVHFKYHNAVDGGTVAVFSSQITTLPATNVQNGIKSKIWRTEDDFIVTARNNILPFHNEKTSVALPFEIPIGQYAGDDLASKIQSGLNETGAYTDHFCTYESSKFKLWRSSTSNGFFRLSFDDPDTKDDTAAILLGFDHATGHNSPDRIYFSTVATLGNEHQLEIDLSATQTVSAFIVDNHNLTESATMILRAATQTGLLSGPYNLAEGIALSSTVQVTEGIISIEPAAPEIIVGGDCEGVPTEFIDNGDCEGGATWREQIDRGDCESTTPPAMAPEVSSTVTNALFARSDDFANAGTYSYKHTIVASGTDSVVDLSDGIGTTDMHGAIPGRTYRYNISGYIDTGTGPQASEVHMIVQYYASGAWVERSSTISGLDAWEDHSIWINVPIAATGFRAGTQIDAAAASSEVAYFDDISVQEVALPIIRGEHENSIINGKVELSDTVANGGTYSIKVIKTSAAGGGDTALYLHDVLDAADLRGLTAGRWYKISADFYTPTSGGAAANRCRILTGQYYSGTWNNEFVFATVADQWESLSIIFQANSSIAGFSAYIVITTNAQVNEFCYVDNISLKELTPPMVRGEITPFVTNCSGTFSLDQAHAGMQSFKIVKNTAAEAGVSFWYFVDNISAADLHGIVPGSTYTPSVWVWIPSGGVLLSEILLVLRVDGSTAATAAPTVFDTWEELTFSYEVESDAVSFGLTMRIATSAALGEFIYIDDASLKGPKLYKTLQFYWHDRTLDKSEVGRIWAGEYFEPEGKQSNTISYIRKKQDNRSTVMVTQSGAAYFSKQQRLWEWRIDVDPLDQFYNPATKEGYETFLEEVEDHTPFYISFEDNLYSSTVYGYLVGDFEYNRRMNTPMFNLKDLVFREQR